MSRYENYILAVTSNALNQNVVLAVILYERKVIYELMKKLNISCNWQLNM